MSKLLTTFILSMFMLQTGFSHAQVAELAETAQNVEFNQEYWIKPPILKIETATSEQKSLKLRLYANKSGDIIQTNLVESSGDELIDKQVIQQIRRAKLKPFLKNGEPVAVNFILPIIINTKN